MHNEKVIKFTRVRERVSACPSRLVQLFCNVIKATSKRPGKTDALLAMPKKNPPDRKKKEKKDRQKLPRAGGGGEGRKARATKGYELEARSGSPTNRRKIKLKK